MKVKADTGAEMGRLKLDTVKASEARIRAHTANSAPYPHPGNWEPAGLGPKPDGKGLKGWRRVLGDGDRLEHPLNGWLATVRPDRPGTVMACLVRYFPTRDWASRYIPDEWSGMVAKAHDGKGNYRLVLSRVFDDADEAMEMADEVMRRKPWTAPTIRDLDVVPQEDEKVLRD